MNDDDPAGVGVLITNLGTPDAPTAPALRRYLAEFLWDPRVIETPRALWWPILHGIILRLRPRRSAEAYAKVWTDEGSPLLTIARQQTQALEEALPRFTGRRLPIALGMRYGNPSIDKALRELENAGCRKILVLPLYPQYCAATTASTYDAVSAALGRRRLLPSLHVIRDYHDDPGYLDALAASVQEHWAAHRRGELLLLSFHGIPKQYAKRGDPYPAHCGITAQGIAQRLGLARGGWKTTFQSRFGPQQWLRPYTDKTLERLPGRGVKRVDLLCPGFSADCLETLEENAMTNRALFLQAGGEALNYIPCLNDRPDHIAMLARLIHRELGGWVEPAAEPAGSDIRRSIQR